MTLVSPDFEGMSLIERHQLVYRVVDEYMHNEIHALTMKTHTPEEYKKITERN
jgi:BolA protein